MDFFVLIEKKTCSLCIGTFGANIIVIIDVVNFIVAVTVITKLICQHHVTSATVGNVLSACKLFGAVRMR